MKELEERIVNEMFNVELEYDYLYDDNICYILEKIFGKNVDIEELRYLGDIEYIAQNYTEQEAKAFKKAIYKYAKLKNQKVA